LNPDEPPAPRHQAVVVRHHLPFTQHCNTTRCYTIMY
jgi:hypothetical protein